KFHKRLTSWKAITLSFGGRFTLIRLVLGALGTYYFSLLKALKGVISYLDKLRRNFFWGGSIDLNKLSWIAWKKVCSSKSCGGLGIGSLYASNIAMGTKWWWRFHKEPSDCNLQTTYPRLYMLETKKHYKIYERVNSLNGIQTTNWNWRRPIRDGPEAQQLSGLLLQLSELNLSNAPDTWNYTLNPSLMFSVASFRHHVESSCLLSSLDPIRWNKHLPIKVNIHA
ncbi:hypothetical protein Tco_1187982, partial [Tanacetum coccineum]